MNKSFFLLALILASLLLLAQQTEPASSAPKIDRLTLVPIQAPTGYFGVFLPLINRSVNYDWTQEAHDAQRSGYTPVEPVEPWTLLWTWNGPDSNGGTSNHFYDAPREARTITGGNNVYVPAGTQGLYALAKTNGVQVWRLTIAAFNATPAYDPNTGYVLAGGANGILYKINGSSGAIAGTYSAGNPINKAVLIAGSYVYALTDNGQLHKVNIANMAREWTYAAGATAGTGLAYSSSRDAIVFGTDDLYIHAINNSNGTAKWRVKPSPNPGGYPNQFQYYFPVVAEQHGIVFVRMSIDWNVCLFNSPNGGNTFPNDLATTRSWLIANPQYQTLFALDLDNGSKKFIPANGCNGLEEVSPTLQLVVSQLPVIRVTSDGSEVAYASFRNGQSAPPDGRWDSNMGEMVLDDTTISGLAAGDYRFIRMSRLNSYGGNSYIFITDEQNSLSMAGETIFHAQWVANESVRITNRSSNLGLTYSSPIQTTNHPTMIHFQNGANCSDKNATTHFTSCGLTLYNDGRYWDGPGSWMYWNVDSFPRVNNRISGILPNYTYVTGNLIIMEGRGGELMVFRHS